MTLQSDIVNASATTVADALKLRRLDPRHAAAQSALSKVIDPLMVSSNNAQLLVALDAPRRAHVALPWLSFTIDGAPGALQLPWGVARKLAGVSVESADPLDAALLVEAGLAPWLDEAEAALGISIRLTGFGDDTSGLDVQTTLNMKGKDAQGSFVEMRQAVRLSLDAADSLIAGLVPRSVPRADLPGLEMHVAWERDAVTLTHAELAELRPGDALALDEAGHEWVVIEGQSFAAAQIEPGESAVHRLKLLSSFHPQKRFEERREMSEAIAVEEIDTNTAEKPLPQLEDIDLRVSFQAGETCLPLRSLREMGPGSIIEMTDPANAEISILVNGRVVGSGELIDVGGRRAVQIRRLFAGA